MRSFLVGSMIVIVSWAIENNLVYFGAILAGSIIVIVSWAIENNLVNFWLACNSFLDY